MPRRSVTRFFIPMIDVLTLLFATFLLLPVLKATAEAETQHKPAPRPAEDTPQDLQRRLVVRVLEIDARDGGKLKYRDPQHGSVPILDELDAHRLIARDRPLNPHEELYYLILVPRDDPESPFPSGKDKRRLNEWFRDVAHGFEDRSSGVVRGKDSGVPK
jgi:hypothetical protein